MTSIRSLFLYALLVAGTTLVGCAATAPDTPPTDDPIHGATKGHCAAIMGPAFTELGAGEADRYWTLVFARPL